MGGGCLSVLGGGVAGEQRHFLFYFRVEELCFIFCVVFFPLLEMSGRTAMLSVYEYSVVVALGPLFLKQI